MERRVPVSSSSENPRLFPAAEHQKRSRDVYVVLVVLVVVVVRPPLTVVREDL